MYDRRIEPWQWLCGLLHYIWQKMWFQMFCASEEKNLKIKRDIGGVACRVNVDCGKKIVASKSNNFSGKKIKPPFFVLEAKKR